MCEISGSKMSRLSFVIVVGVGLSEYDDPRFGPLMRSLKVVQPRKIPSSNDGDNKASTLDVRP